MHLQKLLDASGDPGADFDYHKEVVERLAKVLGPWLTLAECFALIDILAYSSFRFDDGFVISDDHEPQSIIGIADASAIAACFCQDQERDWYWFKVKYPTCDHASEEYQSVRKNVLARIL